MLLSFLFDLADLSTELVVGCKIPLDGFGSRYDFAVLALLFPQVVEFGGYLLRPLGHALLLPH